MEYPDISDLAYWAKREAEERARARETSCLARAVHEELADRYAVLVAQEMRGQRNEA